MLGLRRGLERVAVAIGLPALRLECDEDGYPRGLPHPATRHYIVIAIADQISLPDVDVVNS
jgi:hypothetical protein